VWEDAPTSKVARFSFGLALVLVLASVACAQVKVEKTGESTWVLENAALRVTLDAQAAAFNVLDKRCGQEWTATTKRPVAPTAWAAPEATETVKLDGTVGQDEWPAPRVALGAADVTEGRERPSADDLSGYFHLAWRAGGPLIALSVRDDKVFFPAAGEEHWWEWDSVEFWLGDQQYALVPAPPGGAVLAMGKGEVEGAQVLSRRVDGGWEAEFSLPWPGGKSPGAQVLPFALGINDADSDEGLRHYQLYFPRAWRHSAPETFARTTFAATGQEPKAAETPPVFLTAVEPLAQGDGLRATAPACSVTGRHIWEGTVTLRIEEPADLVVEVDREPRDFDTQRFTVLAPINAAEPAEVFGARYCDGIAVRDDDARFRGQTWGLDMPWIGYGLASGRGYTLMLEDPDDAYFVLETRGPDLRLVPTPYHDGEKGKFGYARHVRYGFLEDGGFVAMCKWYRAYAARTGVLKTLREKMRVRPQLDRMAGAPDFWGGTPALCVEMRRWGIRHAIVNGVWNAEDMERVKSLGYLVSRYDNYEDMLEGDPSEMEKGHIPQDVVKNADGSPMTAWLTFDKKTQFMKRCSMLYPEVARLQVPKDLAVHPYNARFIDVTTACGLRECHDEVHPCTRREDREARQKLADYMSGELKLVLGGEHGRWWGVPHYDYWEGMQSGGFYSWPAGHVGINLPEKREDIGEMYLEFGLGEQRRVPLWELTFGDCTLSTWYWGDSTGHLYKVAPELADKKDCYNLLYGTVPLYWLSQPYSFRWSDSALRLKLLDSYFVTCPVQEQVAFSEMTDYRYLTEDRRVHRSTFANGFTITANFGEEPYVARAGGKEYVLPQHGFLATGEGTLAYRALVDGRPVTWVQTPTALYSNTGGAQAGNGLLRGAGQAAVEIEEAEGRARIIVMDGEGWQVNLAGWAGGWGRESTRFYAEDDRMGLTEPAETEWEGEWLRVPAGRATTQLLYGKLLARPDLSPGRVRVEPDKALQGQTLRVGVEMRNFGNATAPKAVVALCLDGPGKARELGRKTVDVATAGRARVGFDVATGDLDGPHQLFAVADPDGRVQEISEANNEARTDVVVLANLERWPHKVRLTVDPGGVTRRDFAVETDLDLAAAGAPGDVEMDPASVRVLRVEEGQPVLQMPAQFEPGEGYDGRTNRRGVLRFVDSLYAGRKAEYLVLAGTKAQRTRTTGPIAWDEEAQTVRAPAYEVRFEEGKLADWRSFLPEAPGKPFLQWLAASDQGFGWSREHTVKAEVECLVQGPAMTTVRVHKTLEGDFEYTKTYRFYPRYFVVEAEFNKHPSVWSRAAYWLPCHYGDSAGHRTEIDGQGEAEGVAGQAPGVEWFAAWTDTWAHSAVNLGSPGTNLTYWDAGLLGEVGFSTGETKGLRAAYVLHPGQDGPDFAAEDARALTTPVAVTVGEGE